MEKICRHCNSKFEIVKEDLKFYEKLSPVFPMPSSPTLLPKGEGGILPLPLGEAR
jgi:hypothetical protein